MGRTDLFETESHLPLWMGWCPPVDVEKHNDDHLEKRSERLEEISNELNELRLRLKLAQEKAFNGVSEGMANKALHNTSRARENLKKECAARPYCVKPDLWFLRVFHTLKSVLALSDVYNVNILINYGRTNSHKGPSSCDVLKQLKIDGIIHPDSNMELSSISNSSLWFSYASQFHTKDIYYGNYGVDRVEDGRYERQEKLATKGIYAEILFGMLMLREGGSMIIKTYTYFTKKMQCVIGMLFDHFDIQFTKAQFSKSTNSERFIVCMNYRNVLTYSQAVDLLVRVPDTPLPLHNVLTLERAYVGTQIEALKLVAEILDCYKQGKLDKAKRAEFLARCA
tara:strand:+ start:30524 stop:31540 length:1017 start_codon:yes stop_codon:yes gene_type:complete